MLWTVRDSSDVPRIEQHRKNELKRLNRPNLWLMVYKELKQTRTKQDLSFFNQIEKLIPKNV